MNRKIKWQELEFEDDDQSEDTDTVNQQFIKLRDHTPKIPKIPDRKCFWGLANFNITRDIHEMIICKYPGVEFARVFGRYTFLITIGICFDARDVRLGLQKELCREKDQ
jgi:hypothetical protein